MGLFPAIEFGSETFLMQLIWLSSKTQPRASCRRTTERVPSSQRAAGSNTAAAKLPMILSKNTALLCDATSLLFHVSPNVFLHKKQTSLPAEWNAVKDPLRAARGEVRSDMLICVILLPHALKGNGLQSKRDDEIQNKKKKCLWYGQKCE